MFCRMAVSLRKGTTTSRAAGASGPAQSRNHSVIIAWVVFGTAPAWIIRKTARDIECQRRFGEIARVELDKLAIVRPDEAHHAGLIVDQQQCAFFGVPDTTGPVVLGHDRF